jgi:hypothetical protein
LLAGKKRDSVTEGHKGIGDPRFFKYHYQDRGIRLDENDNGPYQGVHKKIDAAP